VQINRVVHQAVNADRHIAEQTVPPVTLHHVGDFLARDGNGLAHRQTAKPQQQVFVIVLDSVNGYVGYIIGTWCTAIVYSRLDFTLPYLTEDIRQPCHQ
jgi:hypothetical protein